MQEESQCSRPQSKEIDPQALIKALEAYQSSEAYHSIDSAQDTPVPRLQITEEIDHATFPQEEQTDDSPAYSSGDSFDDGHTSRYPIIRSRILRWASEGAVNKLDALLRPAITAPPQMFESYEQMIAEAQHQSESYDGSRTVTQEELFERVNQVYLEKQINEAKNSHGQGVAHLAKSAQTLTTLIDAFQSEVVLFPGSVDDQGNTPMHTQAQFGRMDCVKWLMGYQATQVQATNQDNETPLFCAIRAHAYPLVPLFIQQRSDLHVKNKAGNLALHLACYDACPTETLTLLLDHTLQDLPAKQLLNREQDQAFHDNPTREDYDGYTPLDIAILHGQRQTVVTLLDHPKYMALEVELMETQQRKVPLMHRACQKETPEAFAIANLLMTRFDIVNETDMQNNTPLHHAARRGKTMMVDWLLEHDADPTITNLAGDLPLHLACLHNCPDIAANLYQHHRAPYQNHPKKTDSNPNATGDTPLDLAVQNGHHNVIEALFDYKAIPVDTVLECDTPSDAPDGPILLWPKDYENNQIIEYGQSFFVNWQADKGKSLLQTAAKYGRTDVMQTLCSHIENWRVRQIHQSDGLLYSEPKHYAPPHYAAGLSPLELAFAAGHHATALAFLQSPIISQTLSQLIMKHTENNITEILERYQAEPCCGYESLQHYFNAVFEGLAYKIEHIDRLADESDSTASDSSSESRPNSARDANRAYSKYKRDLNRTYGILFDDFQDLPLSRKLDRLSLAYQMQFVIDEIKSDHDLVKKKDLLHEEFAYMSPYYRHEYQHDLMMLAATVALGALLGSILGLAVSAGIALNVTANALGTTLLSATAQHAVFTMTTGALIGGAAFGLYGYWRWFNEVGRSFDKLSQNADIELDRLYANPIG